MSHYWRHPAVPHIEIRNVEDGRTFSHASHAHATFSIGAIMVGQSSYLNGQSVRHISAGSVVLMNPGVVHACNPLQGQPWAYRMFYVDAEWLASVQQEEGIGATKGFTPFVETHSTDLALFAGLDSLYLTLTQRDAAPNMLQAAVLTFFQRLVAWQRTTHHHATCVPNKMIQAAGLQMKPVGHQGVSFQSSWLGSLRNLQAPVETQRRERMPACSPPSTAFAHPPPIRPKHSAQTLTTSPLRLQRPARP